jgi:hypothetical protein
MKSWRQFSFGEIEETGKAESAALRSKIERGRTLAHSDVAPEMPVAIQSEHDVER